MASQASPPLRSAHVALGAVFREAWGGTVVGSYGDPAGEYRAARETAGLVDLSERGVLEASGAQRQPFLQGMLSNEVAALRPGQGRRAALLTPKGAAAPVRFAIRETVVIAVIGPHADEVVRAAGGALPPATAEAHLSGSLAGRPLRIVRASDLPRGGIALHVSPEHAPAVFAELGAAGARPVGREALDALRVEGLRPWYGSDVSEANLLHETGLVSECHSPTKGCYLGQEIVARLSARGGNVNKALRGLRLSASAQAGDAISDGTREVGRVTTAAVSPRLGPIALGYLQRSHFEAGTSVQVGGQAARVVTVFEE